MNNPGKLKILFCTDGIFPHAVGGMQRHSRLLLEALAETGEVELKVIHPHPGEEIFPDYDCITEIPIDPLPAKKYYLFELKDYSKVVLDIARKYPDHVIYSQGLSVWAGMDELAGRTIVNPHGLEPYQVLSLKDKAKTWLFRRTFDHLFKRAEAVVSLGGRLSDILKERMGNRADHIRVLPNATNAPDIAPEQRQKTKSDPLKFFFVGRFAFNKGINILLEAVKQLNAAGWEAKFEIELGGKGPLFEQMQAEYQLNNVKFLGFISDEELHNCYLRNHVFVLPTLFEGMPTVVLEAMSFGMPIIVTDVGATLELVGEENGRIIEKNDVQSLVNAMKGFIEMQSEDFASLSRASREKFEARFTWQKVAAAHVRLFEEIDQKIKARVV